MPPDVNERANIPAVPPQPPRYGLIVAAPVSPLNGVRWQRGVKWVNEQCGVSGRLSVDCDGGTDAMVPERSADFRNADPFMVWAADECSPFGFGARDWSGRATRQLEATQSYEVASELWGGELHQSDGLDGGYLVDQSTLTGVFYDVESTVDALACVEGEVASCSKGRRGMVHMTPQALVHLVTNNTVRFEGGQFLTPLGNIVVADAGYDGSGPGGSPAASKQWMYGTGIIAVTIETAAYLNPGNLEDAQAFAQALDKTDNTVTVFAQKLAMYQWDRCCHVAVEFNLPICVQGS